MNAEENCPQCGGRLKAGPGGVLCARCLLAAALHPPAATEADQPSAAGEQIGAYRIVRLLGQGGMGVVYLAEQEQPIARQVALKIIKLGMDTRAVLARFQSEQQALALMEHPNIAQVYEAGSSAEGRPYFAMEYVPGVPITEYCDRRRLNTRQRLELFVQVANAVQHAHQKGVIHRDLKPSNVLVMERDGEAVPKIIDFGLAKATEKHLTEETLFTEAGVMLGTPEYMSPEQARNARDIDTRTDIYSLGVLLYELLVGVVPFDSKTLRAAGYEEILRVIRETDPPRPATRLQSLGPKAAEIASQRATDAVRLRKEVRGDLDWISLKALEKDPARRYASASDLAADIRRHFEGEPVMAAPPGTAYRLRKFAARHTLELAAASVVLCALLAGLALSTTYYIRANFERERAERQHYIANLAAANQLLQLNQSGPARELLMACPPALRNWEWRYLWRQSDSSLATLRSQGRFLHSPYPSVIAFSGPEICWNTETTVECWKAPSYAAIRVTNAQRILAISQNAGLMLAGADPVIVRALETGRAVTRYSSPLRPWYAILSPDSKRAAIRGAGSTVRIWETGSGKTLAALKRAGRPLAFSPDGNVLALGTLQLASASPPRLIASLESGAQVGAATFSQDGTRLVAGTHIGGVSVWDLKTPGRPTALAGGGLPVRAVAFSPDGNRVAATGYDEAVRIWDGSELVATLPAFSCPSANSIAFSPDGKLLAAGSQCGELRVWDAVTYGGTVLRRSPEALAAIAPSRSGPVALGFSAGEVEILTAGASVVNRWKAGAAGLRALAFSPDGKRVATAGPDHSVRLWDPASARLMTELSGGQAAVTSVAFSPDERLIAAGFTDGAARVWRTDTGNIALTIRTNQPVNALSFAPDGGALATFGGGEVRLWHPVTGAARRTFRSHVPAAFSPDGRLLLAAPGTGEVRIWNSHSGASLGAVPITADVVSIAFSPDGRRIVAATQDGTLQIWDGISHERLLTIRTEPGLRSLLFSPDSDRLLGLYPKQVRMWDTQTVYPAADPIPSARPVPR